MERQIHALTKLYERRREDIIRCLRQTARIHQIPFQEVIDVVSQSKPTKVSPKRKSPLKGPSKKEIVERARKRWIHNLAEEIRASSPREVYDVTLKAYELVRKPGLYSEKFVQEVLQVLLKAYKNRLSALMGHQVSESSIRTNLSLVLAEKGASIEKVVETGLSKIPTQNELTSLYIIGLYIKQGKIKRSEPEEDIRYLADLLMNLGTLQIKEGVVVNLIS